MNPTEYKLWTDAEFRTNCMRMQARTDGKRFLRDRAREIDSKIQRGFIPSQLRSKVKKRTRPTCTKEEYEEYVERLRKAGLWTEGQDEPPDDGYPCEPPEEQKV